MMNEGPMTRTYFVGDLCYVMNDDEWQTVCSLNEFYPTTDPDDFDPQGYLDPENMSFEDENAGRPFYLLKTAFGDGCYRGSDGRNYSVDSGTIGCIAVDDISDKDVLADVVKRGLGHLHEFEDFNYACCGYDERDNSILYFGDLDIPT
jgi:hypothetical protein